MANQPSMKLMLGLAACFTVVTLAAIVQPSYAHDHRPPLAVLRADGERQEGRPLESFWTTADGGGLCADSSRSNSLRWRRGLVAPVGSTARIVFWKRQAPTSLELDAWTHLKSDGSPRGAPQALAFVLLPRTNEAGRTVGWKAVIRTGPTARHYYIRARAQWQDEEGCAEVPDAGYQHASWTFHLRIR